jgi:hypothetical protein
MIRRLALVAVLVVVGCTGSSHSGHGDASRHQSPLSPPSSTVTGPATGPGRLHGVPLTGATGLVLLVSADPAFLLNVDTGRVTTVRGLGVHGPGPVLSVLAVGRDAVVWVDRRPLASRIPNYDIYVVRHGEAKATRIAVGSDVQPATGGRSVWVKSFIDAHHCTLREMNLAGRRLRDPRPIPCSAAVIDPGPGALLVERRSVIDPASGRVLLRTSSLWAIADHLALTIGQSPHPLTLTDLRTGMRRALRWPSQIGGVGTQGGADQAAVDPSGKLIELSFADPAYHMSGTQVTDVWLLDPRTGHWQHLPDMPASVALKFTSMSWTSDGRLVMLAQTPTGGPAAHEVVAVWRPGQRSLAVRSVHIPARYSGSDSFIAWAA